MAPSGGSTSLGTQAREVDDFLTITRDDILNWTPQRLRRQCFQFGLVNEAPEGDVTTLRAVFLKHWRAAVSAASADATQETEGDGAGAGAASVGAASEGLPHSLGGQRVTPPASPPDYGVPSVPLQDGAFQRPERDLAPVPWDLDTEDCAVVDALDSRAEGLLLTPGRDPYASGRGETPDAATHVAGDASDRRRATRHRALPWPITCLVTVLATHQMARAPRMVARMTTHTPGVKTKQWMTWRPRL